MNSKLWIRKTVSSCLMVAMLATYSMVALASDVKATGELEVFGRSVNGDSPVVTVNGESAKTGRTVFSSSSIKTPENSSAIVNMGKAGEIEVAPNSNLTLSFDENSAHVDLAAGTLTVVRSAQGVSVTSAGSTYTVAAGGTASATAVPVSDDDYRDSTGKCIDANKNGKEECDHAGTWWLWALVLGGATAGIIVGTTQGTNNVQLGGGGIVVSPTR
ncbi:MAG: hypothetical protein ABJA02_07305 [Acidobacteriota bacterium]